MPAATARAALDPDKNFSINVEHPSLNLTPVPPDEDYEPGAFHRRFAAASTNGSWGHPWGRCGRMVACQLSGDQLLLRPLLCGTWACQLCGVRRAAWLKGNIQQAQPRDGLDHFWTLTCWTETCTPQESFPFVKRSWNQMRSNLAREYGRFRFVWTVEPTKAGYAHLHLLTDLPLGQGEVSGRWETATGGSFVVQVEGVRSSRAADYLAKYCTHQATLRKEPGWEHLRYSRVFSRSRDVAFEPFREPGQGWAVFPYAYWDAARHVRNGLVVESENVPGVPRIDARAGRTSDALCAHLIAHSGVAAAPASAMHASAPMRVTAATGAPLSAPCAG